MNNRSYYTVLHSDIAGLSQADKDDLFDRDYGTPNKGIVIQTSFFTLRCSLDVPKKCILKCIPQKVADFIKFTNDRSIARTVFTHGQMLSEVHTLRWEPLIH